MHPPVPVRKGVAVIPFRTGRHFPFPVFQVLFRLDDAQYRQQVALAAAELELAEAQLQRRIDGAHEKDRAQAAAKYRATQAELEKAQLRGQRIQMRRRTNTVRPEGADARRRAGEAPGGWRGRGRGSGRVAGAAPPSARWMGCASPPACTSPRRPRT